MDEALTLNKVIARRNDLMSSELSENEMVMLNIERGSYYGLEDTGKAIWNHLDEPRSIADLIAYLRTLFVVDSETCEREVLTFVKELLKDELVRVVEP